MRISAFGSHEIALDDFVLTVVSAITTVVLIQSVQLLDYRASRKLRFFWC